VHPDFNHVNFNSSPRCSVGIEWELQIVDPTTRDLAAGGDALIAAIETRTDGDGIARVKHELFDCTVEIVTGVSDGVDEAWEDLSTTLALVRAEAHREGLDLVGAGTHPFGRWSQQAVSADPRYLGFVERIQWPVRRLLVFGVHVHVGVRSGDRAVAMLGALRAHIPVLLALSTSSPLWQGLDTGLASTRATLFEQLPNTGVPAVFDDWEEFATFMASMTRAQAISTVREIWWDVRPHPDFGTIEFRMFDAMSTRTEIRAAAALAQCLVARLDAAIDDDAVPAPQPDWLVRENKWRAVRWGLDAAFADESGRLHDARDALHALVDDLLPVARRLGCEADLRGVGDIVAHGTSAQRQRALLAGGASTADVVDALRRELGADLTCEAP
jgi:carboxylate-amine ligase